MMQDITVMYVVREKYYDDAWGGSLKVLKGNI